MTCVQSTFGQKMSIRGQVGVKTWIKKQEVQQIFIHYLQVNFDKTFLLNKLTQQIIDTLHMYLARESWNIPKRVKSQNLRMFINGPSMTMGLSKQRS